MIITAFGQDYEFTKSEFSHVLDLLENNSAAEGRKYLMKIKKLNALNAAKLATYINIQYAEARK